MSDKLGKSISKLVNETTAVVEELPNSNQIENVNTTFNESKTQLGVKSFYGNQVRQL